MIVKKFQKYSKRGAYHWEQIGFNLVKRNAYVVARYDNVISLLKEHLGNISGRYILDAGCGDGVLSFLLAKEGAKVIGVDYSKDAIQFAKERTKSFNLHVDFKFGSVYELPLEDSSIDAIVSSDVIEHLEDVPQFLCELKRVAKNKSIIVISTPVRFTEIPMDIEHVNEWFPNEYMKLIESFFDKSFFYVSHPIAMLEIFQSRYFGHLWARILINLISLIWNPFKGFFGRFSHQSLQYSVSRIIK